MRLHASAFGVLAFMFMTWSSATVASAAEVVYARNLALSPDGSTLAFTWAGDIWSVSSEGGDARRLTVHPADDNNPVWSRDGRTIAFASDRHGTANVFLMSATGADVRRLTFSDRAEVPTDFSPDGAYVYFHVRKAGEVAFEPRVYRAPVEGGQDWRVLDCSSANARISPDGKRIAFQRGWAPWWRRGYRGTANHDLWVHDLAGGAFTRLTDWPGNDRDPAWDADGRGLYFLSDRGGDPNDDSEARPAGTVNVWYQPAAGGAARPVTSFTGDDVRDFSISADGRRLALTRWDKVYVMDLPRGRPREIVISATGDTNRNPVSLERFTSNADEIAASPDGKEVALVVRGEIFVIKTEEGKLTRRVTDSPARDRWVTWSPDGKALFFISDRDGQERVYRALSAETPP
ncbi:MAG: PD40 domain-containing protein, partial [Phycisphaerae bacterium]|nr:PD40 domain-containing protein [Phycisphaerae bacterium]